MDYLKNVINGMVTNTSQLISVVSICDIDAGNKISHGYYHFGCTSSPYTLKENVTIDGQFWIMMK